MADLIVHGAPLSTVFLLVPVNSTGSNWIDEHVDAVTRFGNGVAVEHRYIDDIVEGAKGDGLVVEFKGV